MPRIVSALVATGCLVFGSGCAGQPGGSPVAPSPPAPSSPPPSAVAAALQSLAGKAVYFGHQSVGFNIMDGVQALVSAVSTAAPRIEQTSNPASVQKGVFAHSGNGSNGDPAGKIAAFQSTMQSGVGARSDIAFFKFCYVDFTGSTNVAGVFAAYQSKMAALKAAYPNVRLVHVTVPLTTGPDSDNVVRERFSELVRQSYAGKEPVFDLAQVESTRADGSTELFNGVKALVSAYSSDGGHLNATGAELVARALVVYLASL